MIEKVLASALVLSALIALALWNSGWFESPPTMMATALTTQCPVSAVCDDGTGNKKSCYNWVKRDGTKVGKFTCPNVSNPANCAAGRLCPAPAQCYFAATGSWGACP